MEGQNETLESKGDRSSIASQCVAAFPFLVLLIVFAITGTSIVVGVNFGLIALIANTIVLLGTDAVLNQLATRSGNLARGRAVQSG